MVSIRKKYSDSGSSDEGNSWLSTYSDLMTLLLCFFVMLFAFSNVDESKFAQVVSSFRNMVLPNSGDQVFNLYNDYDALDQMVSIINEEREEEGRGEGASIEKMKEQLENAIKEMELDENVKVIERDDYLILRFDSVILFDLSSADIRESAKDVLIKLGNILKDLDNQIIVQGHTDNLPINTEQFPSNWELSTRRATNVVRFFIDKCGIEPSRLTATGNAEFKPVAPNDTPENRQQNRRIDIVVTK